MLVNLKWSELFLKSEYKTTIANESFTVYWYSIQRILELESELGSNHLVDLISSALKRSVVVSSVVIFGFQLSPLDEFVKGNKWSVACLLPPPTRRH